MELNSCVRGMKICFSLDFQGNEKNRIFSLETYDFQGLGNEDLIIAAGLRGYKNFYFSQVGCKVMAKRR